MHFELIGSHVDLTTHLRSRLQNPQYIYSIANKMIFKAFQIIINSYLCYHLNWMCMKKKTNH